MVIYIRIPHTFFLTTPEKRKPPIHQKFLLPTPFLCKPLKHLLTSPSNPAKQTAYSHISLPYMTALINSNLPVMPFDPRMAYDLALGLESPKSIITRYGVTPEEYEVLRQNPQFRLTVDKHLAELKEKGVTFRLKAALQAEALLATAYRMSEDPDIPATVRADLIKWQAKVGNLEPKDDKGSFGSALQININLG